MTKIDPNRYQWLLKKTPRKTDQLKLWPENPRLNLDSDHISIMDFVEDLIAETAEKSDFLDLVKSIAEDGFIPYDPIVIWRNNENGKYYVAEGNRRVLALKILLDPQKAPKTIRNIIRNLSNGINKSNIEKIYVNVAPTFEEAEWYINQRNNSSSLQRSWSRIQQQRWIKTLYDKYNGDIGKVSSISKMSISDLDSFLRILAIKDYIEHPIVKSKLSELEYQKAKSTRFPITILERFFSTKEVRERWRIKFDGQNVELPKNTTAFYIAFGELIKRIVNNDSSVPDEKIDTRTITTNINSILDALPQVDHQSVGYMETPIEDNLGLNQNKIQPTNIGNNNVDEKEQYSASNTQSLPTSSLIALATLKNNPDRKSIILDIYEINSNCFRLVDLFNELKKIPFKYKNSIGASIRVFLDLAIFNFIETENLVSDIKKAYKLDLKDISLKYRIEFLKKKKFTGRIKNIADRLVNPSSEFSLDVLNGYIHGNDTHYLDKKFLNKFWDFLFPLTEYILDIKENK